ncbi:MAG: diacylglycerol/lipid kinase family protein [Ruminococcus sp.]
MVHILYNPLAGSGQGEAVAKVVQAAQQGELVQKSVIGLDAKAYLEKLTADDKVILCGGDGTLNRFANDTYGMDYPCEIYLYKTGTGNDFLRDLEDEVKDDMILINDYIKNLPTVTVKGKTTRFINGIGFGIDGKACEVADEMIAKGKTNINYASISIKLCLFGYKCPNAVVTVDGNKHEFKKVWLASGMNGAFYGGGMNITPGQDRLSTELSTCIIHSSGKLKTLIVFPKLFKGEHIKHKEMVSLMTGKEITVEFDSPMAMQIDGETVLDVTSYTIRKD